MSSIANEAPKRIHPHKFTLWVAMGSIIMMFAGLTSAYIVKKNQSSWLEFDLPIVFMYSTLVIIASSVTVHLAAKAFKAREMGRYRLLFMDLESRNIALTGARSNSAASFLLVITGLHMLHVLGGVIALVVMFVKAYISNVKNYSSLSIELVGTYWHFVDILWIYLFIFYNWIS
jgi:cytochrome c oxidase subunit III